MIEMVAIRAEQAVRRGRSSIPRASRPSGLALAIGVLGITCAASSGCADKRITADEMFVRETAARQAEPVQVDPAALALVDLHPYAVAPGDVLAIRLYGVAGEDRYTPTILQLRVQDDGNIHVPVVGAITVSGLNLRQIEQAITAAHVPSVVKDLSVYVELLETEMTTVLVLGPVATPGLVRLRANERNALYALSQAGGFGATATAGGFSSVNSGRVYVRPIRHDRPEQVYNLNDLNDVRRALMAPPLESGDVIEVEAAEESAVYVSGLVNRAGPIMIPASSTLSVVRAVAAAGGLRDYLDVKEATLVRSMRSGEQVHVKLALGDMLAGREPDLALRPGDVLQIPYTVDTFMQEWAIRNLVPGPFNVSLRYDPLAQYNANRAINRSGQGGTLNNAILQSLGSNIPSLLVPAPVLTEP